MTARLQHLDEIEQCIWSELERCVAPRARPGKARAEGDHGDQGESADDGEPPPRQAPHAFRVAVLATVDDGQADARSIVLREVDAAERRLIFYTDARSPKVRQIRATPQGTLIFYSRELGWQLRMQVRLAVETAGLAVSSRWARLQTSAGANDYLAAAAPGSALEAPLADLGSRGHFAMIEAMTETLDWLELHPQGHRRASFGPHGARWLQP